MSPAILAIWAGCPHRIASKLRSCFFSSYLLASYSFISRDFWVAAAFNSSILLSGVCLGYIDVFFVPWLIAAFWAFQLKRHVLGTALFSIACLTKWQPLIVVPFIAIYLFQISDFRSLRGALN